MWHLCETLEVHAGFWCRYLKEGGHLEDLDVDGMITLRIYLQEFEWGDMEWIDVAQDGNRWRKLVKYGNEHLGSTICGEFLD